MPTDDVQLFFYLCFKMTINFGNDDFIDDTYDFLTS